MFGPLIKKVIFNASDMSGSLISDPIELIYLDNVSLLLVWTGTPTGTFKIEVANEFPADMANPSYTPTWVDLPLTPAIIATGAGDSAFIDFTQIPSAFMRVKYNRSGGSGSLNGSVTSKKV
jgi:hypothetical protein